jgi:hypothetical protein
LTKALIWAGISPDDAAVEQFCAIPWLILNAANRVLAVTIRFTGMSPLKEIAQSIDDII